ncbi:hypothetical protein OOU_Y34scaffold01112g10 [Pyricularia oryzae Y34]|uniref:Uncharacterized protein n=1 Tax=Pyricularia oryzae (strain Y34) TaxID=1143189 RepID=A0AA97PFB5_PYRO3|nr:hypothetical protein OOU_Y34scaffold01112g10 [Pyricularia oryzae Y34]
MEDIVFLLVELESVLKSTINNDKHLEYQATKEEP